MITKTELQAWLRTIPDDADIGIDEGGLTLEAWTRRSPVRAYLEIGGTPDNEKSLPEG